jgi:hypothetical protein
MARIWTVVLAIVVPLVMVTAAATVVASLSAQGGASPPGLYLPVVLVPGVPGSSSGMLQDGGILAGPDGLLMGAISGTLSSPLQITITPTSTPATALDPDIIPVNGFYDVRADRDLYTPADYPLLIGLPVPDGVDTTHLAMAVLIPPLRIPFGDDGLPHWFLFRGIYELPSELLVTAISGLSSSGYQIALVEAPNQTPLTPAGVDRLSPLEHIVSFDVQCTTGYSAGQCGSAQEDAVATELSKAYDDFQELLDFPDPYLSQRFGSLIPVPGIYGYHSYYNIFLVPPPGSDCIDEGKYTPGGPIEICLPRGSSITAYDIETIRHEYFHATQASYDTILNKSKDRWVTDGTATAAQKSLITMTRSLHYDFHMVDVPITDDSAGHRYSAQDFFVFAGRQKQLNGGNGGLDYLKALFDVGASTQAVVDVLGDGSHLPLYWDWAKNQAIEKTIDFDGALLNPCSLQAQVLTQLDEWHFDHTKPPRHDLGTLEPLNSVVVEVIWDGSYDIAYGYAYPTAGTDDADAAQALRYKFYREGESGCKDIPDGPRLFEKTDGEISPDNFYWVLISNIDPSNSHEYTVAFELSPIPPN